MAKNIAYQTVTIAGSGTTSTSITAEGNRMPIAIVVPSAFSGTTLTLNASIDNGSTFQPIYNAGTAYTVNVGTSRYVALNRDVMDGVRIFQIVSSASETAARTVTIITGE